MYKPFAFSHLLECRKTGKLFECEQCDYVSYRKAQVEKHFIEQHHEKTYQASDLSEKEVPKTILCNTEDSKFAIISSGKKVTFSVGMKIIAMD